MSLNVPLHKNLKSDLIFNKVYFVNPYNTNEQIDAKCFYVFKIINLILFVMKKLMNPKGAKTLASIQQKEIQEGSLRPPPN